MSAEKSNPAIKPQSQMKQPSLCRSDLNFYLNEDESNAASRHTSGDNGGLNFGTTTTTPAVNHQADFSMLNFNNNLADRSINQSNNHFLLAGTNAHSKSGVPNNFLLNSINNKGNHNGHQADNSIYRAANFGYMSQNHQQHSHHHHHHHQHLQQPQHHHNQE